MQRKWKKTSPQNFCDMEIGTKVSRILYEGKTETHKWAQNRWIGGSDTLIPLPYFLMKWRPEKRTRREKIMHAKHQNAEKYWEGSRKTNPLPRKRKWENKKDEWENNPIRLYISTQCIDGIKEYKNTRYYHTSDKTNPHFLKEILSCSSVHKIRQEIHPEEKSKANWEKKQKYTHVDYCLGVSHFFWKIIWYFQTEYFFSRTLLTLYQPRIIHEPRIKSPRPTRKPRSAGLKRIATPKMTQIIQKKSIKYSYKNSIDIFTIKQEKSQHHCWDFGEYCKTNYESSSESSRYFEHTIAFSRTFLLVGFLKL